MDGKRSNIESVSSLRFAIKKTFKSYTSTVPPNNCTNWNPHSIPHKLCNKRRLRTVGGGRSLENLQQFIAKHWIFWSMWTGLQGSFVSQMTSCMTRTSSTKCFLPNSSFSSSLKIRFRQLVSLKSLIRSLSACLPDAPVSSGEKLSRGMFYSVILVLLPVFHSFWCCCCSCLSHI